MKKEKERALSPGSAHLPNHFLIRSIGAFLETSSLLFSIRESYCSVRGRGKITFVVNERKSGSRADGLWFSAM